MVRSEEVADTKSVNDLFVPTSYSASLKRKRYLQRRAHHHVGGAALPSAGQPGKHGGDAMIREAIDIILIVGMASGAVVVFALCCVLVAL